MSVLTFYFGWPDGAVWSNLLASLICALLVWWRLRARMIEHHAALLAQGARHHVEALAQAEAHHVALKAHAERHQQDLLDRADVQHEALKKHVGSAVASAASIVAVPQQLLDDIKAAPRRKPGGAA